MSFFPGPMFNIADSAEQKKTNFISIELVDGYPRLRMNLGDGEMPAVTITGKNTAGETRIRKLNDGKWHTIDIMKNRQVNTLDTILLCISKVDTCAPVTSEK